MGNLLNATELIRTVGLVGIWAIIFAETGLLIGFFFPGDSLLFLAGVAASRVADHIPGLGGKHLPIVALLVVSILAAGLFRQWAVAERNRRTPAVLHPD